MPACTRATAHCPGAKKTHAQAPRGLHNWAHNVLVHHPYPLFTVDFQARLHEVQCPCNVKSAHDARDHHCSRGRRLLRRQSQRCRDFKQNDGVVHGFDLFCKAVRRRAK